MADEGSARALTPLFELGVAEAHAILTTQLGEQGVPPLDAVENEDWGRDYLLSRLAAQGDDVLLALGLTRVSTS